MLTITITIVALAAVSATVWVHAAGTAWWLRHLRKRPRAAAQTLRRSVVFVVLTRTAWVLIALHTIEVLVWALIFRLNPRCGIASLEDAVYFSFTTFTTLGYGDITLEGPWRILTGIESLSGMLLIGWSTALSFAVIQRLWSDQARPE